MGHPTPSHSPFTPSTIWSAVLGVLGGVLVSAFGQVAGTKVPLWLVALAAAAGWGLPRAVATTRRKRLVQRERQRHERDDLHQRLERIENAVTIAAERRNLADLEPDAANDRVE